MRTLIRPLIGAALLSILAVQAAWAQPDRSRRADDEDTPSPIGVVIAAKGGVLLGSPRGEFPSLRIGNAEAMGTISSNDGTFGVGNRYGIALLFPFSTSLGFAAECGIQTSVVRFAEGSNRLPVRFDVQTLQVTGALEGNVFIDTAAFRRNGLRSVYISGGFDIGVDNLSNRIEGSARDSVAGTRAAVGSFENDSPFRTLVGLRFGGGTRIGLNRHMELEAGAWYSFALNSLFSSDVVSNNSFTIDNLGIAIGLGYRF
jgi:hypothetical protein